MLSSSTRPNNLECVRVIQACLATLSQALEVYKKIRNSLTSKLATPSATRPNDVAWGNWILDNYPMTFKTVKLLRLLSSFQVN